MTDARIAACYGNPLNLMTECLYRIVRSMSTLCLMLALPGCGTSLLDAFRDGDRDGLSDRAEHAFGTDPDSPDTDLDGLTDGEELDAGTSPLDFDSDHDGLGDGTDPRVDEPSRRLGSISSGNDVEPNDQLDDALVTGAADVARRVFEGRIDRPHDVDVFDLGPLSAGDRLEIDYEHRDMSLRPMLALFDVDDDIFDRAIYPFASGGTDVLAMIDRVVRRDYASYRLAVATRADAIETGSYRLVVRRERDGVVPAPLGQVVRLSFDGGTLEEPILGETVIAPFRAAAIDEFYAGRDVALKAAIVAVVEARFAGLNVVIVTSDDDGAAEATAVSTVLLGSSRHGAFGAAEGVDAFNEDFCDNSVVFTESFQPAVFGSTPTLEDLALAIGQVTAHEIGHLLGLRHVWDAAAIMDEASPSTALLVHQSFKRSPLAAPVFPLGFQNAPALLLDTVGIE